MSSPLPKVGEQAVLETRDLDQLIKVLSGRGYRVIGPVAREGGIVYEEVANSSALPTGWTDEQEAGKYSLVKREDGAIFAFNSGPQSWKKYLHPATLRLWQVQKGNGNSSISQSKALGLTEGQPEPEKLAFLGVHACDLQAIAIQDRVFLQGAVVDSGYKSRREQIFVIAVNCTRAGANCFCASMGTGPKAGSGFDLALTEMLEGERHQFLVQVGTDLGSAVLAQVPHSDSTEADREWAENALAKAAGEMGHSLDTHGLKETLYASYDNAQWAEVAKRCLACSNCTMVCPTCFCTTIEDTTDLTGAHAERWRKWDSCFTLDFSYIHGGSIRSSISSRYRQWLIHKLATWVDQFGTSGCVGCGRCIAWCPVGIDITQEARAIQSSATM